MNKNLKVSTIITTYRRADMLKRAIDSVLNQTYSNIEVIVVDDNDEKSEDRKNTEEIMTSYANNPKVKYIKHKVNMNGAAARNTGIKNSTGEIVCFLDDDDWYLETKIEKQLEFLCKNKDYKAIDLKVNIKQPKISTEAAKSVNTLLAEFSTKFSTNDSNRVTNIVLSAKATSDVLLMPGEEFSYNNLTGKRTKSNGYKDAPVIINGKLEQDVGGGVCQVSSTLFNSVLYSGLDVTSRRNHSLKSSYVSIGRDAMVSDGGSDFRFKNPYSHPVYIKNTVSNGVITSKIYGNASDKKNISIKVEPYTTGGLDAAKTYIENRDSNGNVIRTQYISNSVYKNKNN